MFLVSVITINSVLFSLIILILTLYLYFKWCYTYWSSRGINTPPCIFPFGNTADVALGRVSVQEMFKNLYTDLKSKGIKYSGYYFLHKPVLVVVDMELIKTIMVKDFSYFTDHGLFNQKDYDIFSGHLFSLKGAEWKTMREKLTPLFTIGKLKMMFSTIENCSLELVNLVDLAVKNSEKLNIQDIAGRYTTDVIASIAFGIESNTLKNPISDFRKYGERAAGHENAVDALNLVMQVLIPDILSFFKIPCFSKDITNFFLKIVESTIKYREENCVTRKDFMQLMIQLRNDINISDETNDSFDMEESSNTFRKTLNSKNSCSLSIEDVAAQSILFFIAGYDTASVTIGLCMYELSNQQDIQEKIREEIKTVLNEHEGHLSYNAMMEMTYIEQCIKETLRKYPLVSSLFRQCTKTYKVPHSDLIIEKDMIVMIPANELHYDPEYYPNPEKFDPERFSRENITKRNTFCWLPFGEGPRTCIGARLGIMQIKVALIKLLKDFRYSLDSKTVYPLQRAPRKFFVSPMEKIQLNIKKIMD